MYQSRSFSIHFSHFSLSLPLLSVFPFPFYSSPLSPLLSLSCPAHRSFTALISLSLLLPSLLPFHFLASISSILSFPVLFFSSYSFSFPLLPGPSPLHCPSIPLSFIPFFLPTVVILPGNVIPAQPFNISRNALGSQEGQGARRAGEARDGQSWSI